MKLQLSEVVGHSDAGRVLSVLERYFRDESLEVIRAGDQLTVYGLGPSYRTMNHSDKTIVRATPNHTGTIVDVDSHFLASALMGDMAQDTVVRSKVDRVFQRAREQLMAESFSGSAMDLAATRTVPASPVFPPSEALPTKIPMEAAEVMRPEKEQPKHAPPSEEEISPQKQPVREPDTQPVGTPVDEPDVDGPDKEPPVGEPVPEPDRQPDKAPAREPLRKPFVETTPSAPVEKTVPVVPLAGYAETRTTGERAAGSVAPVVIAAPKVVPGLQKSVAMAQEMKQPVSVAAPPKAKEPIAAEVIPSGVPPAIVPLPQAATPTPPEIKKPATSTAAPPAAAAAPTVMPPQPKPAPPPESTKSAVTGAAAPLNWSEVATPSASTVSLPTAAASAVWVPSFLPESETTKPERSGKRAAVAATVLALLAIAGYFSYQHRSAIENFFVPGSGEHVISAPLEASNTPAATPPSPSPSPSATATQPSVVQEPQDVREWVKAWAAALRSRDAQAQTSFYANPVDRYLLESRVGKDQLLKDKQAEIEKRQGSWTVDAENVVVASQTASDAVVRLTKHITQEAPPGIVREWHIRTQLKLKRINGNWKITAEQTLA